MPATETQFTEIGAFEAKTRLSELLRKVDQGERFTITVRGRPVAELVPIQRAQAGSPAEELEAAFQRLRNPLIEGISHETIRSWIEEGRE